MRSSLQQAGTPSAGGMDFVHDVLHSWTFRVLALINNWSRQRPVLDAGFPVSKAMSAPR